ncbi:MAG: DUF982 domain-containing protein [Mesorhizobium sp.]|jgi:hypothetical protein|uniref:DUF982 domain-containing protein n=1 Tax=Mesorhizobium opportunistum (strain LMG 24607 / HAMBI 3007 / WSM2075) TaxID=536019 RepID=F7Y9F7_MESOW|nr:DUF982 domain-containing protein [Mesorhizobium opportunistum]AEH87604.1 protein of unknown function DUF982 [Mesorhizobium opportunistum WSM2075]ESY76382.1 hypothetical protein X740_28965 [Mesorhizobium sp. LNHC221B00]TJU85326.1 MAG: DUF982 domain-containing protein [Mesorhizobium sp.]TJV38008.1 MAG: DUF982 domain-containing protein [Mesorhizobium sp.]
MSVGLKAARTARPKVNAVGTMKTGVPLKVCLDGHVEEIDNVADAADFLQRWPIERRGHVYRSALNACSAAIAAQISESDAIKVFTGFARVAGILVGDNGPAMTLEARTAQSRLPKQGRQMPK